VDMEHDSIQFDSPLPIVHAWQDAANHGDVDRLLELSDPDIEIVGPRGSGRGHQLLRDWLLRAGLNLKTLRAFVREETVVLVQHGVWASIATGGTSGEGDIVTRFLVSDGRVAQVERYDTLDAALQAAGLGPHDEMKEW
jgi:hypothetical protein